MSLTRKLCKSLGLTDEQTESIIEAHTEVTENMSAEIKNLKEKSAEFEKMKTDFENLINAINSLPKIQKRRIKKYYFDEMTQQQIADEEGVDIRSIQYSLGIALKKLKKLI